MISKHGFGYNDERMQARSPRSAENGITEDAMSNLDLDQHAEICEVEGRDGQEVYIPGGAQ